MKIAILSINTSFYNIFFDIFYKSIKLNFLPEIDKKFFVFSDQDYSNYIDTTTIKIQHEKWPYCTLNKSKYFLMIKDELMKFDYVFYFNSNAEFISAINTNMFGLNSDKDLIACEHSCNSYKLRKNSTEKNIQSSAYIDTYNYKYCFAGISGGKSKQFIEMHEQIYKWTNIDLEKNIIPIWHDESYYNRYQYLNSEKFYYLSHYTCFIENVKRTDVICGMMNYLAVIKLRDKQKYFDVKTFKNIIDSSKQFIFPLGSQCISNDTLGKSRLKKYKVYKSPFNGCQVTKINDNNVMPIKLFFDNAEEFKQLYRDKSNWVLSRDNPYVNDYKAINSKLNLIRHHIENNLNFICDRIETIDNFINRDKTYYTYIVDLTDYLVNFNINEFQEFKKSIEPYMDKFIFIIRNFLYEEFSQKIDFIKQNFKNVYCLDTVTQESYNNKPPYTEVIYNDVLYKQLRHQYIKFFNNLNI